jgi:hypothetical protein
MARRFGIPLAEAIARVNEHWKGHSHFGKVALIYRLGPDERAKNIY